MKNISKAVGMSTGLNFLSNDSPINGDALMQIKKESKKLYKKWNKIRKIKSDHKTEIVIPSLISLKEIFYQFISSVSSSNSTTE